MDDPTFHVRSEQRQGDARTAENWKINMHRLLILGTPHEFICRCLCLGDPQQGDFPFGFLSNHKQAYLFLFVWVTKV